MRSTALALSPKYLSLLWDQRCQYYPERSGEVLISERGWGCCTLGILDFIDDLEDGIDTCVDDREGYLSGGQRQGFATVCGIYDKPAVHNFSEATNALDIKKECDIHDAVFILYSIQPC